MKAKWLILAVVVLGLVVSASIGSAAPPTIATTPSSAFSTFTGSSGELGLYLVGTWSLRDSTFLTGVSISPFLETVTNFIEVVNPTSNALYAWMTLWTNGGSALACSPAYLAPNGRVRLVVDATPTPSGIGSTRNGTVKVLITDVFGFPTIGAVGYRKEIHVLKFDNNGTSVASASISEIRLQPVPPEVLFADTNPPDGTPDELHLIKVACGQ